MKRLIPAASSAGFSVNGTTGMASTQGKPTGRRFLFLVLAIVLLAAGYSAGWYFLAGRLVTGASQLVERINANGDRANCENITARGYPFRIGIFCDTVFFERAVAGVSVAAGALRSAAQVYRPTLVISEVDGPARLLLPNLLPLRLNWETLRASTRVASPLPERFSLETDALAATFGESDRAEPAARATRTELHARPNGADLDLATSIRQFELDPALLPGRTVPPTDVEADLTINNGVGLVLAGKSDLRGYSGTLRNLSLLAPGDTGISLKGPFSIAADGLLDADFVLGVKRPEDFARVLAEIIPEARGQIRNGLTAFSLTGNGADGHLELPLRITRGSAAIGFIPLGRIPPL